MHLLLPQPFKHRRQRPFEQQAVIDSNADLLAVDAFAGTGKTSTLVQYALARPNSRILYIAFNKSVAAEAKERFPANVDCRTTHSLAYGAVGRKFSDKLGNVPVYMVTQAFKCNAKRAKAALVLRVGRVFNMAASVRLWPPPLVTAL